VCLFKNRNYIIAAVRNPRKSGGNSDSIWQKLDTTLLQVSFILFFLNLITWFFWNNAFTLGHRDFNYLYVFFVNFTYKSGIILLAELFDALRLKKILLRYFSFSIQRYSFRLPRIDTEPLRLLIQDSLYDDGSEDYEESEDSQDSEASLTEVIASESTASATYSEQQAEIANQSRSRRDLGKKAMFLR